MAKLNVSIDDRLRDELFKLIPPRRRSQVVNEALRHELLRRKRRQATEVVHRLRKRSATLTGEEIMNAVRRDRERTERCRCLLKWILEQEHEPDYRKAIQLQQA